MNNVLVTGGAGYVGSHACKALAGAGYTPISYDNLMYGHRWAVKWGPLEVGDLGDLPRLLEVIRRYNPVAVMHFAGFAYVGESVTAPEKYYRNNLGATMNLLTALRVTGVNHLVFSSTCSTYGVPSMVPIPENCPQAPASPYGASKFMIERMLADYSLAYEFKSISLRYFNACGADPDGEIGEAHDPETHLIPLTLMAVLGELDHLSVFGTDYPTPDGTCVRDYVHVTDLADAHVKALEYLIQGGETIALNLGTGQGHSVREIINAAERVTGQKVPVRDAPRRPGDPPELVADARRAEKLLDFHPRFVRLDDILDTAWKWHGR